MSNEQPREFWTGLDWLKMVALWCAVAIAGLILCKYIGFWWTSGGTVLIAALGFFTWLYWPRPR